MSVGHGPFLLEEWETWGCGFICSSNLTLCFLDCMVFDMLNMTMIRESSSNPLPMEKKNPKNFKGLFGNQFLEPFFNCYMIFYRIKARLKT